MVAYNFFVFLERLAELVSAVITLFIVGASQEITFEVASQAVITYGICNATLIILVNLFAAYKIVKVDARVRFAPSMVTRKAINIFLSSAGWNGCVIVAMNLYARVDMLIMNLFFGLFGNMVFALANQTVCYVRSFIIGLVTGIDAVASRVAGKQGDAGVVRLMHRSTGLQAIVVLPAMCILFLIAESFVSVWLSGRFEDPQKTIPAIVWLIRILIFGLAARCLSEGWIWIMNGAGHVKKYAPLVLLAGLLNPILAWSALVMAPEEYKFAAPAFVFSLLLVVVHLIGLPWVVAREYKISLVSVIQPIIKPTIVTICSLLVGYIFWMSGDFWKSEPAFILVFSIVYLLATYFVLLQPGDRSRISTINQPTVASQKTSENGLIETQ